MYVTVTLLESYKTSVGVNSLNVKKYLKCTSYRNVVLKCFTKSVCVKFLVRFYLSVDLSTFVTLYNCLYS